MSRGQPATPKKKHGALTALPVILVPIVFVAFLPWLKTNGGVMAVLVASGAAAMFVMGYSNYLVFLVQRRQDEVEKASAGFAAQWGVAAGQIAFVLLLLLPPVLDFATALVRDLLHDPRASQQVVILSMTLGFCGLVLLQGVGSVVARAIWWRGRR